MPIQVKVKCSNESAFTIDIENVDVQTVLDLKTMISTKLEGTPVESQRLIFSGKVLKDADVLSVYKLADGNTIHLVRGKVNKPASSETSSSTPSATTPQSQPSAATNNTSQNSLPGSTTTTSSTPFMNPADPYGFNAFMPGMGSRGSVPDMNSSPFGGGMGGMMDPSMMSAMLSDPRVTAGISQMMSNPQMLDMMINSNPEMARMMTPEARQMMQSEGFRNMLANPQFIQSMLQMSPMLSAMRGNNATSAGGFPASSPFMNPFGSPFPNTPNASSTTTTGTGAPSSQNNTASPNTSSAPAPNAVPTPGAFPPLPLFNPALMSMLMGGAGLPGAPGVSPQQTPSRPPEELYQVQLSQLQDMGFYDAAENVRALTMTGGNVEAAIEWLFSRTR